MFASRSEPQALVLFKKKRVFFENASLGVPKPCLLRFRLPQFFFQNRHACLKKQMFFVNSCHFLSIFVQYLSMYGTVYVPTYYTVLRTAIPPGQITIPPEHQI